MQAYFLAINPDTATAHQAQFKDRALAFARAGTLPQTFIERSGDSILTRGWRGRQKVLWVYRILNDGETVAGGIEVYQVEMDIAVSDQQIRAAERQVVACRRPA